MAEPLKTIYNEKFLHEFGEKVQAAYPDFDNQSFVSATMDRGWEELELKGRIRRISLTLGEHLPPRYEEALNILYAIDKTCVGFPYLFFPDFVEVHGQETEHWELSMQALERFTGKSSAEFAVRPFLLADPERMMAQMAAWAEHPDEHVRRLASEGCRPRLPWGQSLPLFKRDPSPVLPVLERLKADPSLYVRKSVANNLNDIAKDHPGLVIETARRWLGTDTHTDWIVRHGCRTLIRRAVPEVLELFGYAQAGEEEQLAASASITAEPAVLTIGESCELQYELGIRDGAPLRVRIEYGIEFVKARGQTSRKLFLLSDKTVPGGTSLQGSRRHRWADLTTRRHYPGEHRIGLFVNGAEVAHCHLRLEALE
ncbi:3-methyladenine DNA glycosylase AlkC [Paenibacillus sp. UNCCL117]|uniref:DNA alkylation repair protein n=1 Tax=unclassified Paenibacillus TaxID=185978 RepID=UPI0008829ECE|nr:MULTISPECIES: DNA alkylation repair protein [unclassified Paenibacillus]SDE04558.1 3-methyladenine DNA glycosylase AlkC [Paenibacillus sp. cl123]SFW57674.1 3-methyladenine DNA glycosylase AlkC [Paenibacillus sp. UNCCL117]